MLDATELARRLRIAMDRAKPRVKSSAVAQACEVTRQAVSGWRKNGRLAKKHLQTIAKLTGKPLAYFLGAEMPDLGDQYQLLEAEAIARLRIAHPDWRRYVLSLAMLDRTKQELMLATMREAAPDDYVAKHIGDAPHVAARKAKERQ